MAEAVVRSKLDLLARLSDDHPDRLSGQVLADIVATLFARTRRVLVEYTDDHIAVLSDRDAYVHMNKATGVLFTVPPLVDLAFDPLDEIPVRQVGVGQVTFVEGAGVSISSAETLKLRKQGSAASLIYTGVGNNWDLVGDLEIA